MLGATLATLLICLPLFSQGNFGRIVGTVTDQSGGVISGATVTVLDTQRGVARTLTTDDAGEYNAPTLNPGTYTVRVEANGFRRLERQNVLLEVGKEVRVDATLQPGEQTQTVTVTEQIPLVETTNATLGGTLNNADISDLPLNGRNYQSLLGLRPGVMIQPGGGPWTQSTNGVRPDEVVWMVDGVLNVNFYDGRPVINAPSPFTDGATILPVDAIQEFNLEENPKAEYGWKPGAVVNVGVKSGTNTLHGTAYAFGRSDAMDARNYFNPGPDASGTCVSNPGLPSACNKLAAQLKQFGGVVGGPIKKDKLFFFAGYEGLRSFIGSPFTTSIPQTGPATTFNPGSSMVDAINADVALLGAAKISPVSLALTGCTVGAIPSATTCTGGFFQNANATSTAYASIFPNTNTSDNGIAKIDYHINSKHALNGMFFLGNYVGTGEDHGFTNQLFTDSSPVRSWSTVANWIWTPNSTMVNELRIGYDRFDFNFVNIDVNRLADGTGLTGGAGYPINTGVKVPGGMPNITILPFGGGFLGTNQNRPQYSGPSPYYDFQDNVSYLKGKHAFKFGGEIAHIEADTGVYASGRGQIFFEGGNQTIGGNPSTALEDFYAGLPSTATLLAGNPFVKMTWMSYAGYVQDDWHVTPKLTLNAGLRYSYTSPMKEATNKWGSFDPNSTLGMVAQGQGGLNTLWKPDRKDFSPRVGFAWDVTGKGTTVVRGGASVIYSSFVLQSFLGEFSLQNNGSTSPAAVPTAAQIQLGGCATTNTCPPAPSSGIGLSSVTLNSSQLTWNGQVFPSAAAKCGDGNVPAGAGDAAPCDIMGVDPNLRDPYITNWNLGIQHAFTNNLSLEVGYVGNRGSRLFGFTDINQAPLGAGYCMNSSLTPAQLAGACGGGVLPSVSAAAEQQARPFNAKFPWLRYINWASNIAHSNYNSLQATLTQRTSHGVSFVAGYTYAHALDNGSLNRFALLPQLSSNPGAEYANSDFDIRHRFTLTTTYNIPGKKGFGQLLEGWQLNSIINIQTPQPWSTDNTSQQDFSGTGDFADRWNFSGNPADFRSSPNSIPLCTSPSGASGTFTCTQFSQYGTVSVPASISAPCAALGATSCYVVGNSTLTPPSNGKIGTLGRGIFRDTGFKNVDFSVFKNFTFKERYGLQFRAEIFNLFNHTIFANPYGASNAFLGPGVDPAGGQLGFAGQTPDVAAGSPLISSGSNRVMQLGLKLKF